MKIVLTILVTLLFATTASAQLTAPTITATAKGPDQINLTWSAASNPGYGYLVEIQSSSDSRYSSYTEWAPIPQASGDATDLNSDPTCTYCFQPLSNGLPTWVVEPQYVDPIDGGSAAQAIITGLKSATLYNFRVRTYQGYTAKSYSSYSTPASATTSTYTLRYVNAATGNDSNNGTNSTTLAWLTIHHGCSTVTTGQELIIIGGSYANDYCTPGHTGSSGVGNHVVISANPGDTVTITSVPGGSAILATNSGIGYVIFDGIKSTATTSGGGPLFTINGNHAAFFGLDIDAKNQDGIRVFGDYNLFSGNYFHDVGTNTVDQGDILYIDGTSGSTYTASNNIIQYNHLTRGSHGNTWDYNVNLATAPNHNQFMNNIADGGWGNAYSSLVPGATTTSPNHDLFEGNIGAYMFMHTSTPFKECIEDLAQSSTWRRNICIDGGADGIELNAFRNSVTNGLHYNNVIYTNLGYCFWNGTPAAGKVYTGTVVTNNICTKGGTRIGNLLGNLQYFYQLESDMTFSYNDTLYYSSGVPQPNQATIMYNANGTTLTTVAYQDANNNPPFSNNAALQLDPQYVNETGFDFHLKSGSPLAGAATVVTDTTWGTIANTNLGAFDGTFSTTVTGINGGAKLRGATIQ